MQNKVKQAVILAGGKGTRLGRLTEEIPKPLVKVGGEPILVHIMRRLRKAGIKTFFILTGYLSRHIEEYFLSKVSSNDEILRLGGGGRKNQKFCIEGLEDAEIVLVYTGPESGTAQRLYKAFECDNIHLDEYFAFTYGDSYSDIDFAKVVEKSESSGKMVTLTGVPYTESKGIVKINEDGDFVSFEEKSSTPFELVNGGYMVLHSDIFKMLDETHFDFSRDVLESGRMRDHIAVYKYNGYWRAVDTERDLEQINKEFKENEEFFK